MVKETKKYFHNICYRNKQGDCESRLVAAVNSGN